MGARQEQQALTQLTDAVLAAVDGTTPWPDATINAAVLAIEQLAASATELRTQAHRDEYPGTSPPESEGHRLQAPMPEAL